jgi:hypothetical protein
VGTSELDRKQPTAVISISSFSGFGLHQILSIHKSFPNYFKQFVFVSAAVVDSAEARGVAERVRMREDERLSAGSDALHGWGQELRLHDGAGPTAPEVVARVSQ